MLPADFLTALFAGCEGLAVCLSHKSADQQKGMRSRWYTMEDGMAARLIADAQHLCEQHRDVYFSTCPAKKIPASNADMCRVRRQDVSCIPAYFMDVDTSADEAKAGKRVPESVPQAVEALMSLPCPPSALVQSGHGLHAYWLLDQPASPSAAPAMRAFADAVARATGFPDLDTHATEPARILRVPGTMNYKHGGSLPVRLLDEGTGEHYTAAALDTFAAEHAPAKAALLTASTAPVRSAAAPSAYPADAGSMLDFIRVKGQQRTRDLLSGDTRGYGSHSDADLALCNDLAFWCRRDAALMDGVFRLSGLMRDKWDRRQSGSTYGALTIQKAISSCRNVYGDSTAAPLTVSTAVNPAASESPFAEYEAAYGRACEGGVYGYASVHGNLYQVKQDAEGNETRIPLSSFTPLIARQETLDDGAAHSMRYVMQGVSSTGESFPACAVTTEEFASMKWPGKHWGLAANISPGTTIRDKIRYACQEASKSHAQQEIVYTATGWRDLTGTPCYVTAAGAIGEADAHVELEGGLERYALTSPENEQAAARASFELLGSYPLRISAPLLGFMYLAPLTAFLEKAQCPPSVTLWMQGRTQSGKSTAAGLFMSHFGPGFCSSKNPPATFHDSPAALHRKAFLVKDAPLLIDDYHPVGSRPERERMTATAQTMIRGWSNRSERARANSDRTVQAPMPPRGIGLCTGEDVPDVGESGVARLYVLRMTREDKLPHDRLDPLNTKGRQGLYAAAMAGYVSALIPEASALPGMLRDKWEELRAQVGALTPDTGGDLTENAAFLLLGLHMALRYFVSAGASTGTESEAIWQQAITAIVEGASNQAADLAETKPSALFISALRELLATQAAQTRSLTDHLQEYISPERMAGYHDDQMFYFIPGAVYGMVRSHLEARGAFISISDKELWRHLRDEKLLHADKDMNPCKGKNISGKTQRLLWIHRSVLEGAPEPQPVNVTTPFEKGA